MNDDSMAFGPGKETPEQQATKLQSILAVFISGTTLNRFDAERHHDHCLHSTVSALERYGVEFDRRWESVPCLRGRSRVRCKRYWLRREGENVARAAALCTNWGRA